VWRQFWCAALAGVGVLSMAGGGYATGLALGATRCASIVALACLAGVTLAVVGLFRRRQVGGTDIERGAAVGLLAYVVLAAMTEQFAWAWGAGGVAIGVGWLVPLALGGAVLPPRGCWFAGIGCWAVLFGATAALTCTVSHGGSGVGLFFVILE
jgi:hypothetical protein